MGVESMDDFRGAMDRFSDRDREIAVAIRRGSLFSYVTIDPTED